MRFTYISKYANGWANNPLQLFHFPRLGYSCLENSQLLFVIHRPYRKWNTDLGIVALWAANNIVAAAQQLVQPFFYHCFAIAARYAYYRYFELLAVRSGYLLQRCQGIPYFYYVSARYCACIYVMRDQKTPHSFLPCIMDEAMAITQIGFQGDEEGILGLFYTSAVYSKDLYIRIALLPGKPDAIALFSELF